MTQVEIDHSEWPERRRPLRRGAIKRSVDVLAALGGLLFFAPLMIVIAIAIALMDGRPIVYSHERIGRGGRAFGCLKFRTMYRGGDTMLSEHLARNAEARAEWEQTRKLRVDPRVGCLGRVLRRSSLDELPQLWNILRGDMSIVGPRPIVEDERHHYGPHMHDYLSVRPGLTGMWQVSGRSDTTYEERVALDVAYVRGRTTRLDLWVMARTVAVLLTGRGAR